MKLPPFPARIVRALAPILLLGGCSLPYSAEPLSSLPALPPPIVDEAPFGFRAVQIVDPSQLRKVLGPRSPEIIRSWMTFHVALEARGGAGPVRVDGFALEADGRSSRPLDPRQVTLLASGAPGDIDLVRLPETRDYDEAVHGPVVGWPVWQPLVVLVMLGVEKIANGFSHSSHRADFDRAARDLIPKTAIPRVLQPGERRELLVIFRRVAVRGGAPPLLVARGTTPDGTFVEIAVPVTTF